MADAEAPLTILYFAWLRERTGVSQESVAPPVGVHVDGDEPAVWRRVAGFFEVP